MSVDVRCSVCKKVYTLEVTIRQLGEWKTGKLIQEAMPQLTPGERELLISRTCGDCFDKMFGGE